jgi:hypothetical protein
MNNEWVKEKSLGIKMDFIFECSLCLFYKFFIKEKSLGIKMDFIFECSLCLFYKFFKLYYEKN